MQLTKLSLATTFLLSSLYAEDYIHVQMLQYNEHHERASISAPSIEINKDFGTDYSLNGSYTLDSISGASPTFYDTLSGASAYSRGETTQDNITYGGVEYDETKRMAGALSGTKRFKNRDEVTLGASFSNELDYRSTELSLEGLHWLDDGKNQSISLGIAFQRNVILVECEENSICDTTSGASKKLRADLFSAEASFSQNIDSTSRIKTSLFFINEDGYLSNPFMNVVRHYDIAPIITNEMRPEHRRTYGGTLQYTKAISQKSALHTSYRYYHDDWEINSHTFATNFYHNIYKDLTLGTGLRYYTQDSAYFYAKERDYFTDQTYASSDERMGGFHAYNISLSAEYKIRENILYDISANYYKQDKGTTARYFTTGLKYTF